MDATHAVILLCCLCGSVGGQNATLENSCEADLVTWKAITLTVNLLYFATLVCILIYALYPRPPCPCLARTLCQNASSQGSSRARDPSLIRATPLGYPFPPYPPPPSYRARARAHEPVTGYDTVDQ